MQKYRDSLPSLTMTLITLVLCLVLGLLISGITWNAILVALFFAWIFLGMAFLRNFYFPVQPQFRTERDELYKSLKAVVDAVEADPRCGVKATNRAAEAHDLLDDIDSRYKPKTKAK